MKKVKITVMRVACYRDLMEKYENPIEHACDMEEGMVFVAAAGGLLRQRVGDGVALRHGAVPRRGEPV